VAAITRANFRTAVASLLTAQQAATPGLLRDTFRHNPGQMGGEKPIAWQGEIAETLIYSGQLRERTMVEQVQLATTFPADDETDNFDDLVDALVERFTANFNVITTVLGLAAQTVVELIAVEPNEVDVAGANGNTVAYKGMLLTVRTRIWEPRQ
jgi:hypothetical protein